MTTKTAAPREDELRAAMAAAYEQCQAAHAAWLEANPPRERAAPAPEPGPYRPDRASLFRPWTPKDAQNWGLSGSPVYGTKGYGPLKLPVEALPQRPEDVTGGSLAKAREGMSETFSVMERERPKWLLLAGALTERKALLARHREDLRQGGTGLAGVVEKHLAEEIEGSARVLADRKHAWAEAFHRHTQLAEQSRLEWQAYERTVRTVQWFAAYGFRPSEPELLTLERLIGSNALCRAYPPERPSGYQPR